LHDVANLIDGVCHACATPDVPELSYLCISNRLDTVLGKAVYNTAGRIRQRIGKANAEGIEEHDAEYVLAIILNNNLFWKISDRTRVEIAVHETCHIIDFYLQLRETGRIVPTHNDRWKWLMWICGFTPREYVPYNELGITTHSLYCNGCDSSYATSRTKKSRVRNGTLDLYCRSCKTKLSDEKLTDLGLDKCRSA
jgi:predicted SprT family Zn-dependent metalloprotease